MIYPEKVSCVGSSHAASTDFTASCGSRSRESTPGPRKSASSHKPGNGRITSDLWKNKAVFHAICFVLFVCFFFLLLFVCLFFFFGFNFILFFFFIYTFEKYMYIIYIHVAQIVRPMCGLGWVGGLYLTSVYS